MGWLPGRRGAAWVASALEMASFVHVFSVVVLALVIAAALARRERLLG